jgi:hypothetical protein
MALKSNKKTHKLVAKKTAVTSVAEPPKRHASDKVKKLVDVALKNNIDTRIGNQHSLSDSYKPFASRFFRSMLREQGEIEPDLPKKSEPEPIDNERKDPNEFTPESDKEAFDNSLEPSTNPDDFETQGIPAEYTSDTINSIKEWSDKLGEFANFLNDPSTESLHKILADGDRAGSLLRGVTRKASDSITRIAGEVEKLKEILNTYIITAPKKLRDTEQLKAGS